MLANQNGGGLLDTCSGNLHSCNRKPFTTATGENLFTAAAVNPFYCCYGEPFTAATGKTFLLQQRWTLYTSNREPFTAVTRNCVYCKCNREPFTAVIRNHIGLQQRTFYSCLGTLYCCNWKPFTAVRGNPSPLQHENLYSCNREPFTAFSCNWELFAAVTGNPLQLQQEILYSCRRKTFTTVIGNSLQLQQGTIQLQLATVLHHHFLQATQNRPVEHCKVIILNYITFFSHVP